MRRPMLLALAVLFTAAPAFARPSVEVNTCGQVVPKGYLGHLAADLDCTGNPGATAAIVVRNAGTLDLRGFTLTSDAIFGVFCGTLEPYASIERCGVRNGTVTGAPSGHGIIAKGMKAEDLVVTGAQQMGIYADGPFRGTNLTINGNGTCGIRADRGLRVVSSTITDNAEGGICAKSIRLVESTVIGNGVSGDPDCNQSPSPCADLRSPKKPKLTDSTCETSWGNQTGQIDWNVCTLD